MVHGLGGTHVNWSLVAPGLSGLGTVLALDLPGFGRSPLAGRGSGLMDLRRTLSRLIEKLAINRVIVCGNSMGGALSILQAAVEPDSVSGLVLTSSVFPVDGRILPHPLVVAAFATYASPWAGERFVARRFQTIDARTAVKIGFAMAAADPSSIPHEIFEETVESVEELRRDPDAPAAFLGAARSMVRLGRHDEVARRALDAVSCPVLVLHGRRDRLVPAAYAEAELARHPSWRGRIFPDLGHVSQLEAPGRWLAEVADWLAESFQPQASAG